MLNMCLKKDPALIVRDKDNNSQLLWHREIMMKSSPQPASTPLFSYKVCSHYGQHFEKRQLNSLTSLCQNYNFLSMDIICLWEEACQINPMISNQLVTQMSFELPPPSKTLINWGGLLTIFFFLMRCSKLSLRFLGKSIAHCLKITQNVAVESFNIF